MSVAVPETPLTVSGGVAWSSWFAPQPMTGTSDAATSAIPVRVRQNSTVGRTRRSGAEGLVIVEALG
jgi:hypothetical protein